MRGVVNFGKPTLLAILLAAPIGNTTILLLFSLSLETLLALLLFRERGRRLGTAAVPSEAPVTLLCRTVPHLRSRRPTPIQVGVASSRWRTTVGEPIRERRHPDHPPHQDQTRPLHDMAQRGDRQRDEQKPQHPQPDLMDRLGERARL